MVPGRQREREERRGGPSSSFSDPLSLMEVKTSVLICSIHTANSLWRSSRCSKLCEEEFLDSCFSCRSAQQTLFFLAAKLKVRISLQGKLCILLCVHVALRITFLLSGDFCFWCTALQPRVRAGGVCTVLSFTEKLKLAAAGSGYLS